MNTDAKYSDLKNEWMNIPSEEYHARPEISSHGLADILQCPDYFKQNRLEPKAQTPAMRLGSIIHAAQLQPELYYANRLCLPDFGDLRSSKNREVKANYLEKVPASAIIVTQDENEQIDGMIAALRKHPFGKRVFEGGVAEQAGIWKCPEWGVWCRMLADYRRPDELILIDYKTAEDASLETVRRVARNHNWRGQAAFYLDGASVIDEANYEKFVFLVQEKTYPYRVATFVCDDFFIQKGRNVNRKAMKIYSECLTKDVWPSYPEVPQSLGLLPWETMDE